MVDPKPDEAFTPHPARKWDYGDSNQQPLKNLSNQPMPLIHHQDFAIHIFLDGVFC